MTRFARASLALLIAGRAEATPTFGPGTSRYSAGEPADAIYGTPIPGYPRSNARGL